MKTEPRSVDLLLQCDEQKPDVTPDPSPSSPGPKAVQDVFLDHLRQSGTSVTVFLVNGVKLQGIVAHHDVHTLLLRRDGHVQLVYKHAISTIMPVATMPRFMESDIERI